MKTRLIVASGGLLLAVACGTQGTSESGGVAIDPPATVNVLDHIVEGGVSPCATAPSDAIFCDDFDTEAHVNSGWTSVTKDAGASAHLDAENDVSAPYSYRARGEYLLTKTLAGTYNAGADISFDLRVHTPAAGVFLSFAAPTASATTVTTSLSLDATGDLIIAQSDGLGPTTITTAVAPNTWTHVEVSLTRNAIGVRFNGASVYYAATLDVIAAGAQTRTLTLGAGADGMVMNFDNVLVRDPVTTWNVVACSYLGAELSATAVDSAGFKYSVIDSQEASPPYAAGQSVPSGLASSGPLNVPKGLLDAADLANLLAAATTMDRSTAGYTTTTEPNIHDTSRVGHLASGGAPGENILTETYTDGATLGHATFVTANDPAAAVIQQYTCILLGT